MRWRDIIREGSPDTVAGSYTPDLVFSKQWLCAQLAQLAPAEGLGTVYALGSWYGNLGVYLQQSGVVFDHLVLVELDPHKLAQARQLLPQLIDQGAVTLCLCDAAELEYPESPITVINTSTNEMSAQWLDRVPGGTLVAMQGRSNTQSPVPVSTATLSEFDQTFPLSTTLCLAQCDLEDPEVAYQRFTKIGCK